MQATLITRPSILVLDKSLIAFDATSWFLKVTVAEPRDWPLGPYASSTFLVGPAVLLM